MASEREAALDAARGEHVADVAACRARFDRLRASLFQLETFATTYLVDRYRETLDRIDRDHPEEAR